MSQPIRLLRWPAVAVAIVLAVAGALSLRPAQSSAAAPHVLGKVTYTGLDGGTGTSSATLSAFDWKAELAPTTGGGGGGSGKPTFGGPRLVESTSAISPHLMGALVRGRHLPTVKVVLNQSSSSKPFQTWVFTDAQLGLAQQSRTRSAGSETVSFSFSRVTQTVFKANGTTVAATTCWNAAGNAGC